MFLLWSIITKNVAALAAHEPIGLLRDGVLGAKQLGEDGEVRVEVSDGSRYARSSPVNTSIKHIVSHEPQVNMTVLNFRRSRLLRRCGCRFRRFLLHNLSSLA